MAHLQEQGLTLLVGILWLLQAGIYYLTPLGVGILSLVSFGLSYSALHPPFQRASLIKKCFLAILMLLLAGLFFFIGCLTVLLFNPINS